MTTLYLVRGIPGSGKSTFAKNAYKMAIHLEADMYFMQDKEYKFDASKLHEAHKWCYSSTELLLRGGFDVIVSNTFTTLKEMKQYLELAETLEDIDLVIYEMKKEYGSIHSVPEETIAKMKARWYSFPTDTNYKVYRLE